MPRVAPLQANFNKGEISPLVYGRVDIDPYKAALGRCYNGVPIVQGPWTRRPGTRFVNQQKDQSKVGRVVPFQFSVTQAYILLFEENVIRIFKDNAIVTATPQNITAISKSSPATVTYSGADTYANGDPILITGVAGMTEVNNREFIVANVNAGANTFQLSGVDSTNYTTYTSGGTVAEIIEVTTTYAEADIPYLKFAQSADTLYITHPSYAPRKLTRTSHTTWTLTTITFLDGPYLSTNTTSTTLTPSAATGTGVTLTASAVTGINGGAGFASTDVGRLIRIKEGSVWGYVRITGWTSTTVVTVDVVNTLTNTSAKSTWRMGEWSGTSGYPAAVTFFEDRLFFAGCTDTPQRIDGSKTGDYENFAPSDTAGAVADDNAVAFTLNANDVNVIRWLADDEKGLIVGTVGGEWIVRPSASSEALSPTNIKATRPSSNGSANHQPVRAGKSLLFINRSKRKLRELAYVFEVDGFRAPDMTTLSEHITSPGITQLAYQQNPQSIVWSIRSDGVLVGFTYEREQQVLGWHWHELGGYSNAGGTAAPVIESIAVIPSADGTRDELWMTVKRYIDGGTKRYVEYMTQFDNEDIAQEDCVYVDCSLVYDSTATTTITGLWHLEGQTVTLLVDGATHPTKTVSSGSITLERSGSVVQIGYGYNSEGETLRPEAGAADGTAQGKKQRTHRLMARVNRTLGIQFGPDFDNMHRPPTRAAGDDAGSAVALYTGDMEIDWEGDYTYENVIAWRCDQPLPATILALMPQLHTQDR